MNKKDYDQLGKLREIITNERENLANLEMVKTGEITSEVKEIENKLFDIEMTLEELSWKFLQHFQPS